MGVDERMNRQRQNEGGEALARPEVVGADSRVRRTCREEGSLGQISETVG